MKTYFKSFIILSLAVFFGVGPVISAAPAINANDVARYIIIADSHTVKELVLSKVRGAGGDVISEFESVPGMAVILPTAAVQGLANNPHVKEIGLDTKVYALDAELDDSWGVKRIGAGTVHAYNQALGVKVAVIDTGIDYTHPDLNANYAGGYDFVNSDSDPLDDNNHGTHVSGIIAAEDDGAGVVGIGPRANIYALKVLDASGSGYWSDIIKAIDWAVANNIQVVNMSLGASSDAPGVHDAIKNAYNAGIVLVAAAGNSGNCGGKSNTVGYPARYEEVIAVGATDQNDYRPCFSSTGDQLELAAPGVSVLSTVIGGGYASFSGTSMASPHVAGVAALVLANGSLTDQNGDGALNNVDLRLWLRKTADDLGVSGKDSWYGYGLVDADEAAPNTGTIDNAPVANAGPDQTAYAGVSVSFDGSQSTDDRGIVSYNWDFGDGTTASGVTVSHVYAATGTYTVTLTVTDGGGLSASDAATVIVSNPPAEATQAIVDSVSYSTEGGKNQNLHLKVTLLIVDDLGNPVEGATVFITLNHDSGASWNGTGTTDSSGQVAFKLNNSPSGCYTTTITNVSTANLTWNGNTPSNGFCK